MGLGTSCKENALQSGGTAEAQGQTSEAEVAWALYAEWMGLSGD